MSALEKTGMRPGVAERQKEIAAVFSGWHFAEMSMAELMRVVASLPAEQQQELAGFLLHLRLQQHPEWRAEMARRIDDADPSNWTSLGDWKKELAADKSKG